MAGITILRNFWKTGSKIPIKIKPYLNKSDSKIIQMNLSGNFPSIDGSEVHFSSKSNFRPFLTTYWSKVVTRSTIRTKCIEFAIFDLVFKVTSDAIIAREMLLRSLFKYFLRRRYEQTYAILYTINIIIL